MNGGDPDFRISGCARVTVTLGPGISEAGRRWKGSGRCEWSVQLGLAWQVEIHVEA